jgi:hypothetical protein
MDFYELETAVNVVIETLVLWLLFFLFSKANIDRSQLAISASIIPTVIQLLKILLKL